MRIDARPINGVRFGVSQSLFEKVVIGYHSVYGVTQPHDFLPSVQVEVLGQIDEVKMAIDRRDQGVNLVQSFGQIPPGDVFHGFMSQPLPERHDQAASSRFRKVKQQIFFVQFTHQNRPFERHSSACS